MKWIWGKYLHGSSIIWCARPPQNASWVWRSILKVRPLAEKFMCYNIGDGRNTSFFLNPWLGSTTINNRVGDSLRQDLGCAGSSQVSVFIANGCWHLPPATTLDMHELWPDILASPIAKGEDFISWILDANGFTLLSACRAIQPQSQSIP